MKCTYLHQGGSATLLLFFNGWGMDDHVLAHLAADDADVLTVCDYTTLAALPDLSAYRERYLVAWSLGVLAAAAVLSRQPQEFSGSVACNGTLRPVDAEYGIPPALVQGTIDRWLEPLSRSKFYHRVWGRADAWPPERDSELQQLELQALVRLAQVEPPPPNPFRRALVSTGDRIMPASSQVRYWEGAGIPYRLSQAPHDLFSGLRGIREVIDLARA